MRTRGEGKGDLVRLSACASPSHVGRARERRDRGCSTERGLVSAGVSDERAGDGTRGLTKRWAKEEE